MRPKAPIRGALVQRKVLLAVWKETLCRYSLNIWNFALSSPVIKGCFPEWGHCPACMISHCCPTSHPKTELLKMTKSEMDLRRCNSISIKTPARFSLTDIDKIIFKFICEIQGIQNCQNKQEQSSPVPDIKAYYKATEIKNSMDWHEDRHRDWWNRLESPEINP